MLLRKWMVASGVAQGNSMGLFPCRNGALNQSLAAGHYRTNLPAQVQCN